jgi:hypothetical protein
MEVVQPPINGWSERRSLGNIQDPSDERPSPRADHDDQPEQFEAGYQKGTIPMNPLRKMLVGGALAVATITGGAVGASFLGAANAATT